MRARTRRCRRGCAREQLRERFERELRFQESNITEVGEREMTERLRASWQRYAAELDAASRAAPDGERATSTRVEPSLVAVERSTDDILAVNQDAMVRKSERARRERRAHERR